jgi:hypothetical protein
VSWCVLSVGGVGGVVVFKECCRGVLERAPMTHDT